MGNCLGPYSSVVPRQHARDRSRKQTAEHFGTSHFNMQKVLMQPQATSANNNDFNNKQSINDTHL